MACALQKTTAGQYKNLGMPKIQFNSTPYHLGLLTIIQSKIFNYVPFYETLRNKQCSFLAFWLQRLKLFLHTDTAFMYNDGAIFGK